MDQIMVPQGHLLGPVRDEATSRNALSILFKWKWLIVGTFAAVLLPVTISSYFKPTFYRASVTTIVKKDRGYLSISPGADDPLVNLQISRSTINSELKIITSREVIERVVQEFARESSEEEPRGSRDLPLLDVNADFFSIQGGLDVSSLRDSNLIEIGFTSTDAQRAVKIVNKIADVYLERHAEINRPQGAYHFFDRQANTYFERLQETAEQLKKFEIQEGIVDLEKEMADSIARVGQMEREKQAAETEVGEVKMRLPFLRGEIKKHPEKVVTEQETVLNRSAEDLRNRVLQLEIEKKRLLQLYTEKDRRVVAKQEEIDAVRTQLAAEQAYVRGRESSTLNPIRRSLEEEYVKSQARAESLVAKQETLQSQIAAARIRLAELNEKSSEYARLKGAVQLNQQSHSLYKKRMEEARISEAMDREKLLNVAIVERAALPLRRKGGRAATILLLAAITGIALGVAGAFGIEFFNSSINSEKELEELLELPVLVTIEKVQA